MAEALECWIVNGETICIDCSDRFTGAVPVKLQPPRKCSRCQKNITDPWPDSEGLDESNNST